MSGNKKKVSSSQLLKLYSPKKGKWNIPSDISKEEAVALIRRLCDTSEQAKLTKLIPALPQARRHECISNIPQVYWENMDKEKEALFNWTPRRILNRLRQFGYSPAQLPPAYFRLFLKGVCKETCKVAPWNNYTSKLRLQESALFVLANLHSQGKASIQEVPYLHQFLKENLEGLSKAAQRCGAWGWVDTPSFPLWFWEMLSENSSKNSSEIVFFLESCGLEYSNWPSMLQNVAFARVFFRELKVGDWAGLPSIPLKFMTKQLLSTLLKRLREETENHYQYMIEDGEFEVGISPAEVFCEYYQTYPEDIMHLILWCLSVTPEKILQDKAWWDKQNWDFKALLAPLVYPNEADALIKIIAKESPGCLCYSYDDRMRTIANEYVGDSVLEFLRKWFLQDLQVNSASCCVQAQAYRCHLPDLLWLTRAPEDEDLEFVPLARLPAGSDFKDASRKLAPLTGLTAEELQALPEYHKAVIFPCMVLARAPVAQGKATVRDAVLGELAKVRGWRDACSMMPLNMSWRVFEARQRGEEVTYTQLTKSTQKGSECLKINPWHKFPYSTYSKLLEWAGYNKRKTLLLSQAEPAANIARLFGSDTGAALRYLGLVSKSKQKWRQVHDAGVGITLPDTFSYNKEFADFCLKHPGAPKFFNTYEQAAAAGITFKSLEALKRYNREILLGDVPPQFKDFREYCADHDIEGEAMREAISMASQAKKSEKLVQVNITLENGDHVSLLPKGDLRALVIGEESGCCQSVGNVGEDAATHSFTNPDSGVYTFRSATGTLLAQSWVWLSKDEKFLMFDSIESRFEDKNTVARVVSLMLEFVKYVKPLGFTVLISDTGYGMTEDVVKSLRKLKAQVCVSEMNTPEAGSCMGYSDAGCTSLVINLL